MDYVAAIVGLGVLCGAWVLVQRYFAHHDPGAPGVEGHHTCHSAPSDRLPPPGTTRPLK